MWGPRVEEGVHGMAFNDMEMPVFAPGTGIVIVFVVLGRRVIYACLPTI